MQIRVSIQEAAAADDHVSVVISMPNGERPVDTTAVARLVEALARCGRPGYLERLVVRNGGRIVLLKTSDVDSIEAEGNYVLVRAGKERHMVRETIGALEMQLDPARFQRIHRSTIVNVDRVRELRPQSGGDYRVVLDTGAELTLSRGYRDALDRLLEA